MIYNRAIGLPDLAKKLEGKKFNLSFTRHALLSCLADKYGQILPPKSLVFSVAFCVEVEANAGQIIKFVLRLPYNEKTDLIIVVLPDGEFGLVKTVWLNLKTDTHRTLNAGNYQRITA